MDSEDEENSDDDDATTAKKKANRVANLIATIEKVDDCSFETAKDTVLNSKAALEALGVTQRTVKKLDFSTFKGREKAKKRIFRKMLNDCIFQSQLMMKMKEMSGENSKEKMIDKCFEYPWEEGYLDLYLLQVCDMDHTKIKEKYESKDELVYLRKVKKYYDDEHQLMKKFNWDKILKHEETDLRAQAMNAVEYRIDPDKKGKYFPTCYDNTRAMLRTGDVRINECYISGYNNKKKKSKKPENIMALPPQERLQWICQAYNSGPNGCTDKECKLEHACLLDFMNGHGVYQCLRVRNYFRRIGQLSYPAGRQGQKRTRQQRDDNNGNRGGRGRSRGGRGGSRGGYTTTTTRPEVISGPPGTNTVMFNGHWYDMRKQGSN